MNHVSEQDFEDARRVSMEWNGLSDNSVYGAALIINDIKKIVKQACIIRLREMETYHNIGGDKIGAGYYRAAISDLESM